MSGAAGSRRRLLHFAQEGDTSGYFPQLARWHDRRRFEMHFGTLQPMAPRLREYMETEGVACFECGCPGRRDYPAGLLKLVRYLRRQRIDLLHTHLFDPSVVGLIAGFLARTPARVMTRHYSDYHTRINKRWHVRLDRLCTRLSHRVIAVSEATRRGMIADEGAPPDRVRVIHNGIDFDRLRLSSPEAPARLRAEFAPQGEFLLLQVGRMHPEKGYPELIDAMPRVRAEAGRPVRLLIAGAGPLRETFEARARERGVADCVQFLGFRQDVPDLMAAADLFVLASVAEAFGLVLAEALYMGTPVLATRAGGIPEIVTDGVDGILVEPGLPDALAAGILDLIRHPDRRRALAAAGRERGLRDFSFERMMRRYEALYDDLVPV